MLQIDNLLDYGTCEYVHLGFYSFVRTGSHESLYDSYWSSDALFFLPFSALSFFCIWEGQVPEELITALLQFCGSSYSCNSKIKMAGLVEGSIVKGAE